MTAKEEKRINDERLISIYKEGFSHISSVVDQVKFLWPTTADVLVDAYSETNNRLLEQVRSERDELEAEIKRFLARANSKLVYIANMEKHLSQLQQDMERINQEARAEVPEEEDGERGERSEE